jgi:hypothetical protein
MSDFFTEYFEYAGVATSEPPAIFHRWASISMISALLGRQCWFPFGHDRVYPNQYVMIMGSPGTRKSSAINVSKKLLKLTGYNRFSSSKTSKERFLMDMKQFDSTIDNEDDLLGMTLDTPSETYIAIGEFTDFIGQNNMEFVTMLTNLWDCLPEYENPKIHGKSTFVHEPVVNILGGNTAQGFTLAFPPEALGNGFLSRLIFVHGEATGRKVTFPSAPDPIREEMLVQHLIEMKRNCVGAFSLTAEASKILDRMYQEEVGIHDNRFKHYGTRRFVHLLKVSLAICASEKTTLVTAEHALKANTVLYYAERKMPRALGEFGKSKFSDISSTILDILNQTTIPQNCNDIFRLVSQDIGKMSDLQEVVKSLQDADRIQLMTVKGKTGFLAKHVAIKEWDTDLILPDYLTKEEMM